ncbi:MAG TPA: hypothetical protein PK573_05815 [Spirochaetota bacterium]|nr:hypothetical protein [Spirochaetota bacterium]HRZ27646.1 hypothetical protein [Spirochaetota bacterium]HSA15466.1 hypothetical protein [Spirochaetota bacterium]
MKITELYSRYKDRMPSWLWLLMMLFGICLVICVPIAFIYIISHFEGVASAIFLVIGWFVFGSFAKQEKRSPLVLGGAVLFFALMGMAIDQTGNIVYNQPLALLCPEGTTYARSVATYNPLPGRTDFVQNFQCIDTGGKPPFAIPMGLVILTRFAEYIFIAYLLLGIRLLLKKIRGRPVQ